MCLAVPMKISEIPEKGIAIVESEGAKARISTALIENPKVDDYVIIHAGYAIEKIDVAEADKRIELFKELAELKLTV